MYITTALETKKKLSGEKNIILYYDLGKRNNYTATL